MCAATASLLCLLLLCLLLLCLLLLCSSCLLVWTGLVASVAACAAACLVTVGLTGAMWVT